MKAHKVILMLVLSVLFPADASTIPEGMALIPSGKFAPMYAEPNSPKEIEVASFLLDIFPVTNGDYLAFVTANPQWSRSKVKRLFADKLYLQHWKSDAELGVDAPTNAPVTHVSWHAAKAYAEWRGKRLPSTAEWELAAAASPTRPDGRNDKSFSNEVLEWYGSPSAVTRRIIGQSKPNFYGVHDLHGMGWEWVGDFNNALVSGDGRENGARDRDMFCGGAAQGARDMSDYPAFIRIAFRSSLKANYCVANLSFRCAQDLP
ncbi:MAG TPA: formylglycine-generating enzyme family protein [Methylomirabilota bacterium]|nr:formylglycine-generating enzyme family protein [Methylomirabilota bacterium]